MKVANVIEMLSNLRPDEEIFILWWDKSDFDYLNEEDGLVLTEERWGWAVHEIEKMSDYDSFGVNDHICDVVWEWAQEPEEVTQ